jgi:hypothetical protein
MKRLLIACCCRVLAALSKHKESYVQETTT